MKKGEFAGLEVDEKSGFIHLSTAAQCPTTAALYYKDQKDLLLVEYSSEQLGKQLRWDPVAERNNDEFPHYYDGPLPVKAPGVTRVLDLALGADGKHVFPSGFGK